MKDTWVLSVKTSLPKVCYRVGHMDAQLYVFESFVEARDAVRRVMRELAFSENAMFDGQGNLTHMLRYIRECTAPTEESADDWVDDYGIGSLTGRNLIRIYDALCAILRGEDVEPQIKQTIATDWMIGYYYGDGELQMFGDDDGPCNGCDPTVRTNMFSMVEEKSYFFYVDDCFGQDEVSAQLYIDLKKADPFPLA